MPNPYLYELLDGFRFPTTQEIRTAMIAVQEEYSEEQNKPTIRNDYFTTANSMSDQVEMFAEDNRMSGGMTYFHTFGSEPRSFTLKGGAAKKVSWSGVHFMEFDTVGHDEILKLAQLNDNGKRVVLTERIAKALKAFDDRQRRRENWICAQILTKGVLSVDHTLPDNPERVSYDLDFRVKNREITLSATEKWNHKDAGGKHTADIVGFALDLQEQRRDADLPEVVKYVMNSKTYNEMKKNTVIYEKYWQRLIMGHAGRIETRDIIADPRLLSDQFDSAFKTLTGISIEVRDDTVKAKGGNEKLIPDGHVSVLYKDGPIGEFTYLAHLYGTNDGGKPSLGTGPFTFSVPETGVTNPSYTMYHGFNAMPILTPSDYNYDFEYELLQTMQVLE